MGGGAAMPLGLKLVAESAGDGYGRGVPARDAAAHASLMGHDWSGNVRELKNTADRFVLSSHPVQERLAQSLGAVEEPLGADKLSLADHVRLYEKRLLQDALVCHGGNISAVMEDLSIPRRTLNAKMAKYNLARTADQDESADFRRWFGPWSAASCLRPSLKI